MLVECLLRSPQVSIHTLYLNVIICSQHFVAHFSHAIVIVWTSAALSISSIVPARLSDRESNGSGESTEHPPSSGDSSPLGCHPVTSLKIFSL